MSESKKDSWYGCVKELFKYLKLEHMFKNHKLYEINYIINTVKFRLKSKFIDMWKSNIFNDERKNSKSGNKLRTYRTFKQNFCFEPYLNIGNREQKRLFSKFRLSDHCLEIELGRYKGLDANKRICQLCKNAVEDEPHFLLNCPELNQERLEHLLCINNLYKNYKKLTEDNQFIWLMSAEDNFIIKKVYNMLQDLFKKRKFIMESVLQQAS